MKTKLLSVFLCFAALIGFGLYYFNNAYEQKLFLFLPPRQDLKIKISDSAYLFPYLSIDRKNILLATINFETFNDSLIIKHLDVNITNTDNLKQSIALSHILVYEHPPSQGVVYYIKVKEFGSLPDSYKTINPLNKSWNTIMLYFETDSIDYNQHYNFKISGNATHNGKTVFFTKEISIPIKKGYFMKRMMTYRNYRQQGVLRQRGLTDKFSALPILFSFSPGETAPDQLYFLTCTANN